jgi:hypothetical protein
MGQNPRFAAFAARRGGFRRQELGHFRKPDAKSAVPVWGNISGKNGRNFGGPCMGVYFPTKRAPEMYDQSTGGASSNRSFVLNVPGKWFAKTWQ